LAYLAYHTNQYFAIEAKEMGKPEHRGNAKIQMGCKKSIAKPVENKLKLQYNENRKLNGQQQHGATEGMQLELYLLR
jgi:hypothetical protein